jgi:hypothetical protein
MLPPRLRFRFGLVVDGLGKKKLERIKFRCSRRAFDIIISVEAASWMVWAKIIIHNGRGFIELLIREEMRRL